MHITIIEDNVSMAKAIAYVLRDEGHAVDVMHDGEQADAFLRSDDSELIILDINLPGLSGIRILERLRERGDLRPVILLSARAEPEERVAGLDAGADDYLVKPFDMAELLARVRAQSRRRVRDAVYRETVGLLEVNHSTREVIACGNPLHLPRRELALFELLLKSRDRVVSKGDVLDKLYGTGSDVEEKVVEVIVSRLRKRISPYRVTIRARRGIGYVLEEQV